MLTSDPAIRDHKAWLGYVQQEGLVVSPAALADAQVVLDRNTLPMQERFLPFVTEATRDGDDPVPAIADFPAFARGFLQWPEDCLYGLDPARPLPGSLSVTLQDGETLTPSLAFANFQQSNNPPIHQSTPAWLLLAKTLPLAADLDARSAADEGAWSASPTQRMERLLHETRVPIGLLTNGTQIRLIYAPHGENSGNITFHVKYMSEVAGRPILAALHMLLGECCSGAVPTTARLPALLARSREYQSAVSTTLAQQVLDALYEMLRGFQAANEHTKGELLRSALQKDPDEVYAGLLNVLMRLVFLLFAEDRGIVPTDPKTKRATGLYVRHYSVHGLFERLRADAEHFPDTMDQRYGAWAQLLALFRVVHDGCKHPQMQMPARRGNLFDPARFPFLEGRIPSPAGAGEGGATSPSEGRGAHVPLVSDGTIFRVLQNLLILDGERLSYRRLDVSEIGSVYQTIMGFRLEVAPGPSIAIKANSKRGSVPAATVIDLDGLLATPGDKRGKWLNEKTDQVLPAQAEAALKSSASVDALLAALEKKIARNATPSPVAKGGMTLQPTDERRRSGSHYTPQSFTGPIVRKTLEPILKRLAAQSGAGILPAGSGAVPPPGPAHSAAPPAPPTAAAATVRTSDFGFPSDFGSRTSDFSPPRPEDILNLKICDIAVGSAAFLVETCRQLGDALVKSWRHHGGRPPLPDDETEELLAMRLIAQHCLYGVDRNPVAVDLAKLSLWLATLAKDHPFTFLDHAIRCGDSLVGLSRRQIEDFTWGPATGHRLLFSDDVRKRTAAALRERQALLVLGDDYTSPQLKRRKLEKADELLETVRFIGDAAIAAFFSAAKDKAREQERVQLAARISNYLATGDMRQRPTSEVAALRGGRFPVTPFHCEIEFPEVFDRDNPGFDAIVGNPPFMGGSKISTTNGESYLAWLLSLHEGAHGNGDLVAHFFRRAHSLLRPGGCFGLIATNTIGQGDTRATGLRWICKNGGTIYSANKRFKWPGQAAVVVSVVYVQKAKLSGPFELNGKQVPIITAFLFHAGTHDDPPSLQANHGRSFMGAKIYGQGFVFDDSDAEATPLAEMNRLLVLNPKNEERIFPYIGGQEINEDPRSLHRRFVINFSQFPLRREDIGELWQQASTEQRQQWSHSEIVPSDFPMPVAADWPDLLEIIERKVKPERMGQKREVRQRYWWRFGEPAPSLFEATRKVRNIFVTAFTSKTFAFAQIPAHTVCSHSVIVLPAESWTFFSVIQSRLHEMWSVFFGSSMKDDPCYTPSTCLEPFPFPESFVTNAHLETAGQEYYEFRARFMVRNNEGLTKTYNRFHDPEETSPDILRLRELHATMDRAVLVAYGWRDLIPQCQCEFLLDYEDEEGTTEETGRRRKKPWRYRWPDPVRDEVLARLLKLNAERAHEEKLAGLAAAKQQKPTRKRAGVTAPGAKTQMALGLATPVVTERKLPAGSRPAASQPLLYTANLVVALLSEAGGSLAWRRLLDGFLLATNPKLMQRFAPAELTAQAKAWAARWNEKVQDGLLLTSLKQVGGKNLTVIEGNDGRVFQLLDGPRSPATEDVRYDAWLALRVAETLTPEAVQVPDRAKWTKEANALVFS